MTEAQGQAWVQALVQHAACVGVPEVDRNLQTGEVSPDRGESFWQAVQALGLYAWYAGCDPDTQRQQANNAALDVVLAAQADVAADVERTVLAIGSKGGVWLKAMAVRHTLPSLYPSIRHRIATDVDVWFAASELERVAQWLERHCGYVYVPQAVPWPYNYELALASPEGVLLELHDALGPRRGIRNWFGRLTWLLEAEAMVGQVLPLSVEMQLAHAVVHFFQHAGHLKYYQLLEMLILLEQDQVRNAARLKLLGNGYDNLWAWAIIRLIRLWPQGNRKTVPDFLLNEQAALPQWQRRLWSAVLDTEGIWRGPWPYRGPKALAVILGL